MLRCGNDGVKTGRERHEENGLWAAVEERIPSLCVWSVVLAPHADKRGLSRCDYQAPGVMELPSGSSVVWLSLPVEVDVPVQSAECCRNPGHAHTHTHTHNLEKDVSQNPSASSLGVRKRSIRPGCWTYQALRASRRSKQRHGTQ